MVERNASRKNVDPKKKGENNPLHRDATTGRFTKKTQNSAKGSNQSPAYRKGTDGTGPGSIIRKK